MPQPTMRAGLLLVAALLCGAAAADSPTVYKWVDKDGHVHYGDTPTSGARAKPVNPNVFSNGEDASIADPAAAAAKEAACKHKAQEYAQYKNASGLSETDALGNTRTYTKEEKDKVVERKRQDLVQQCGQQAADNAAGT